MSWSMSSDIAVDNDAVRAGSTECFAAEAALIRLVRSRWHCWPYWAVSLTRQPSKRRTRPFMASLHFPSSVLQTFQVTWMHGQTCGVLQVLHVFQVDLRLRSLPLVHYAHFQTSRQSDSFTQQPQRCRISKIPISKSASARSRVRIACEGKFALSEIYHKFAWQPAGFCA